jgi:hypothetical protein
MFECMYMQACMYAYIYTRVCVCGYACILIYIKILVVYNSGGFVDELASLLDMIGQFRMVLIRNGGDYGYDHGLNELI